MRRLSGGVLACVLLSVVLCVTCVWACVSIVPRAATGDPSSPPQSVTPSPGRRGVGVEGAGSCGVYARRRGQGGDAGRCVGGSVGEWESKEDGDGAANGLFVEFVTVFEEIS